MNDPYCVNCAFLKTCTKYPNKNIYYMHCEEHSSIESKLQQNGILRGRALQRHNKKLQVGEI